MDEPDPPEGPVRRVAGILGPAYQIVIDQPASPVILPGPDSQPGDWRTCNRSRIQKNGSITFRTTSPGSPIGRGTALKMPQVRVRVPPGALVHYAWRCMKWNRLAEVLVFQWVASALHGTVPQRATLHSALLQRQLCHQLRCILRCVVPPVGSGPRSPEDSASRLSSASCRSTCRRRERASSQSVLFLVCFAGSAMLSATAPARPA